MIASIIKGYALYNYWIASNSYHQTKLLGYCIKGNK